MDRSRWFDDSDFPSGDGFDSPQSWSQAIFNEMEGKFQYERGGEIKPISRQEMRTYARAYAMAEMDSHPVLRPNILKAATRAGTENLSQDSIDVNAKRLKERFQEQGWIAGDTSLTLPNSNIFNDEFVLIRGDLWLDPNKSFREESVVSRSELRSSAEKALQHYYLENNDCKEESQTEIEILTTAIETRLRNRNWTHLGFSDENGRLWVEPSDIYADLSIHEENTSLTNEEIEQRVIEYFKRLDLPLQENAVFDLDPVVNVFNKRLRDRDWRNIELPVVSEEGLEIRSEWYQNSGDVRGRLSTIDDRYRNHLEDPGHEREAGEVEARRRETYGFYERNSQLLAKNAFFDSVGELESDLELYAYRVEAAQTWLSLEEAEVESGRWNPGENDWHVEDRDSV